MSLYKNDRGYWAIKGNENLITPEELRALCAIEGSQNAFAKKIGRTGKYVNGLCNGRYPITDNIDQIIRLIMRESGHHA